MSDTATFHLVSGRTCKVTHVFLHEATGVRSSQANRLQASTALRDSRTGVGTIGSPEWVLLSGLALGVLDKMFANAGAKAAIEHMQTAEKQAESAKNNGRFIPITDIKGIDSPEIEKWSATGPSAKGFTTWQFIHDGSERLLVRTTDTEDLWIWIDKIESFCTIGGDERAAQRVAQAERER
jgi:hypothetical protein